MFSLGELIYLSYYLLLCSKARDVGRPRVIVVLDSGCFREKIIYIVHAGFGRFTSVLPQEARC